MTLLLPFALVLYFRLSLNQWRSHCWYFSLPIKVGLSLLLREGCQKILYDVVRIWKNIPILKNIPCSSFSIHNTCSLRFFYSCLFSHILERGTKKGITNENRTKESAHCSTPSKHAPSPVDEKKRVEEFEKRLRYAMEQSLYLQAQHLSALDKFEKDLEQAKEESLLSHVFHKSHLKESNSEKGDKPLKGILKKSKR